MSQLPDGATPVVGYRTWRAHLNGPGFLVSMQGGTNHWPTRCRMVGRCRRVQPKGRWNHEAPGSSKGRRGCTCGIYIGKDIRSMFTHPSQLWVYRVNIDDEGLLQVESREMLVHGTCAGWGRVREHERGWRVGFAYPQSFLIPPAMWLEAGYPNWPPDWSLGWIRPSDPDGRMWVDLYLEKLVRLGERYGVPLVPMGAELIEMAGVDPMVPPSPRPAGD